jgi:3-hydroxyacyl-CoA dehydrogenase
MFGLLAVTGMSFLNRTGELEGIVATNTRALKVPSLLSLHTHTHTHTHSRTHHFSPPTRMQLALLLAMVICGEKATLLS